MYLLILTTENNKLIFPSSNYFNSMLKKKKKKAIGQGRESVDKSNSKSRRNRIFLLCISPRCFAHGSDVQIHIYQREREKKGEIEIRESENNKFDF